MASGAQDYLVKGRVEPETLRRSLLYAIERKRAELIAVELHASRIHGRGGNARLERGLQPSPLLLDDPERRHHYAVSAQPGAYALLGGDFYDVVQTPDRTVHVIIGDVAGHGPDEAAIGGGIVASAWRALTFAEACAEIKQRCTSSSGSCSPDGTGKNNLRDPVELGVRSRQPEGSTAVRAGHPGMLVHGNGDRRRWLEPPAGPALGV